MAVALLFLITYSGTPPPLSEEPGVIVGTEGKTNKDGIIQSLHGYHGAVKGSLSWLVVAVAL